MPGTARYTGATLALALLTACGSGAGGSPAAATAPAPAAEAPAAAADSRTVEAGAEPTTADGIFTAAQAARGRQLFDDVCSECHETSDWTEAGFRGRWEDQSVFQLWYYINDRMPYNDPFSLTREQVTDVLTYILQLNDLPAGDAELGSDDDSIDDFWIAWAASR